MSGRKQKSNYTIYRSGERQASWKSPIMQMAKPTTKSWSNNAAGPAECAVVMSREHNNIPKPLVANAVFLNRLNADCARR